MSEARVRVKAPSHCVTLEELAGHENGTWVDARVADTIAYPLPAHAPEEVLNHLRPLALIVGEAGGVARLTAGRVHGSGAVLSADGTMIARDVSGDLGNDSTHHWLIGYPDIRSPRTVNGSVGVAAVNLGEGYAHWLLEELPRLLTLPTGEVENLVVHAGTPFTRQALAIRRGKERVIAAKRRLHLACAPLIVPRLISGPGAPSRRALELIDGFTAPLGREASPFGERIYLTREKAGRRRVKNEAELWCALEELGFAKVTLEEMTWDEQIAACRRARVVVAPHGAGLANLAFCAAGTRVVELVNRAYYNSGYWRLSALRGIDYRVVVSRGDGPLCEDRRANREDIQADVAQVRAALR